MRDIASVGSEKKEIRRKRKASAIVALAFELIDQWMRKFNKRKLYFVVPHLRRLQNNPVGAADDRSSLAAQNDRGCE